MNEMKDTHLELFQDQLDIEEQMSALGKDKILGSEGTVGWGGVAGTYFGIDPKENMIFILMIQLIDFNDLEISDRFKTLVYQSIVENLD